METSPIKKIGGECAPPIHQHYTVQRDAYRAKAQGRRKYLFSDQIDHLIREIYLNHSGAKTRPGIRVLANKVGIPHWALKKRARELGLARTKELPWSDPELDILGWWGNRLRAAIQLGEAGQKLSRMFNEAYVDGGSGEQTAREGANEFSNLTHRLPPFAP